MKHYPSSSGILGGEGYGAMKAWKTIQEFIMAVLQAKKCLLVLALEGTVLCLNSDTEPEANRTH